MTYRFMVFDSLSLACVHTDAPITCARACVRTYVLAHPRPRLNTLADGVLTRLDAIAATVDSLAAAHVAAQRERVGERAGVREQLCVLEGAVRRIQLSLSTIADVVLPQSRGVTPPPPAQLVAERVGGRERRGGEKEGGIA